MQPTGYPKRGFEKTNFDLQILTFNKNKFTGKVQDDLNFE